jgi:hypothetical protein
MSQGDRIKLIATLREQIEVKLDTLDENELAALLHYIDVMQSARLPEDYDPAIGFFSGPPDLAIRAKETASTVE